MAGWNEWIPGRNMTLTEVLDALESARVGLDVKDKLYWSFYKIVELAIKEGNANFDVEMAKGVYDTLKDRLDAGDSDLRNISVDWINKNLGKLDQTFMSEEFLQQMAGTTPINAVPADESVTNKKLAKNAVSHEKADFIHSSNQLFDKENAEVGYLDNQGGVTPHANYRTSGFIKKGSNTFVRFSPQALNGEVVSISYFDINGDFLYTNSTVNTSDPLVTNRGFTIPEKYQEKTIDSFRVSHPFITQNFMLSFGDVSIPYEDYSSYLLPEFYTESEKVLPKHAKSKRLRVANMADSIWGNHDDATSISSVISEYTDYENINLGFGGSRLARHDAFWDAFSFYRLVDEIIKPSSDGTKWALQDAAIAEKNSGTPLGMPAYFDGRLERLKQVDWSKIDVLTVAMGTNDFASGKVQVENPLNAKDVTTFKGAYRYGIEKLLTKYPHIKCLLITPIYRVWSEGGAFVDDSDTYEVTGQKLTDFVRAVEEVGKEFKLPTLNLYDTLGWNKFNWLQYYPSTDGTHPKESGRRRYGERVANELKEQF